MNVLLVYFLFFILSVFLKIFRGFDLSLRTIYAVYIWRGRLIGPYYSKNYFLFNLTCRLTGVSIREYKYPWTSNFYAWSRFLLAVNIWPLMTEICRWKLQPTYTDYSEVSLNGMQIKNLDLTVHITQESTS